MQNLLVFLSLLSLMLLQQTSALGKNQKVKVKGTVFCPSDPSKAAGITIKMKDKDRLGIDDNMGSTTTGSNGAFEFEGQQTEVSNIDPYLKIYHDCNDGITPCQRLWIIGIPDRYINKGIIDLGTLNLEMKMNKETHDCLH